MIALTATTPAESEGEEERAREAMSRVESLLSDFALIQRLKPAMYEEMDGCQDGRYLLRATVMDTVREIREELPAIAAALHTPAASGGLSAWVGDMKTSAGMEYFVCVGRPGGKFGAGYLTPNMYRIRARAEYDVAKWNHLLNGGPEPSLLAFDTDEPSPAASVGDLGPVDCMMCGAPCLETSREMLGEDMQPELVRGYKYTPIQQKAQAVVMPGQVE